MTTYDGVVNKTYVALAASVLIGVVGPAGEIREVVLEVRPIARVQEFVVSVAAPTAKHVAFSVSETTSHGQFAERPVSLGIPTDPGVFYRTRTV